MMKEHNGMSVPEQGPIFTGLVVYRNLQYRYSFLYPDEWHQFELDTDGGQGVILSPYPDDVTTSISTEARDLGMTVTADDLPTLREGFLEGLHQLPGVTIEREESESIGTLLALDAWCTYDEAGARRKRWTRLYYQGQTQLRMIAQGATIAQYDYWLPMLNEAMRTLQFGDWWAEATGQTWLPSLDQLPEVEEPGGVGV